MTCAFIYFKILCMGAMKAQVCALDTTCAEPYTCGVYTFVISILNPKVNKTTNVKNGSLFYFHNYGYDKCIALNNICIKNITMKKT